MIISSYPNANPLPLLIHHYHVHLTIFTVIKVADYKCVLNSDQLGYPLYNFINQIDDSFDQLLVSSSDSL